jgi:hypothetical protein
MKNMQNTKLYLYAAGLIAGVGITFTARAVDTTNTTTELQLRPDYRTWTLGAEIGTTGIGGFGSWRFAPHLGLRAGFDYFQWTEDNLHIENLYYNAKVRLMSEPFTLDIYPWQKHSFRISAGVMFNQNQLTGSSSGLGPVTIGDQVFQFPQVGTLNLKMEQQLVNPYLSIGGNFLYFDRAHHWALGGELGVAYTGDAKVSLTRTSMGGPLSGVIDAAVSREQQKAQDWANQYKWFPVIKLTVTYSF